MSKIGFEFIAMNKENKKWARAMQDRHAKDNAFNKYADSEYLYQGTDIQAIGSQIIQDLNNPEIIFKSFKQSSFSNIREIANLWLCT